jgi:DEAD/DEAH box helicase domain-containing protein
LTVQVQLWVRELRGLVRRLQPSGHTFAWRDELDAPPNEHYLPLVYCRECGADGLGALVVEGSPKLKGDSRSVGEAYLRKAEEARFVQLNEQREDDNQLRLPERVCPSCLRVAMGEDQCSCQPGGGAHGAPQRSTATRTTSTASARCAPSAAPTTRCASWAAAPPA